MIAAGATLLVLLAGGGIAMALTSGKGGQGNAGATTAVDPSGSAASATSAAAPVVPADEQCTEAIKSNPRWVCLTKATMDGNQLTIEYQSNSGANPFNINGSFHLHIYGANATGGDPADSVMGSQASRPGNWYIEDKQPSVHEAGSHQYQAIDGSPKVCARIAKGGHQLVADNTGKGTFKTGNCVPLTRT
jgi:hypothetical protein